MNNVFKVVPRGKVVKLANENSKYKQFFDCIMQVLSNNKNKTVKRGKNKEVGFESANKKYVTLGSQALRNAKGISVDLGAINDDEFSLISSLMTHVENITAEFMEPEYNLSLKHALNRAKCKTFPMPNDLHQSRNWGALALSIKSYLNLHTDIDFGYSAMICLAKNREILQLTSSPLAFMCFPKQGVSAAIRDGDILLFNPLVPHCVSSRTTDIDVAFITFYLKTNIVGGHDNSQEMPK
jgi:hypothetical protein